MQFKPLTEEDLEMMNLVPAGIYDFEIIKAENKISSKGNEMINLTLRVFDDSGAAHTIFDIILAAFPRKLRNFCKVTGLLEKYELGNIIAEDCAHRSGTLKLVMEPQKPNPNGGFYKAKNIVDDYVVKSSLIEKQSGKDELIDDSIPF